MGCRRGCSRTKRRGSPLSPFQLLTNTSHYQFQLFLLIWFQQEVEGRSTQRIYHILIKGAIKHHDEIHRHLISQRLQHLETRLSRHLYIDEQHIGLHAHHQGLCRHRRRGSGYHLEIFQGSQIVLQPQDALWLIIHYYYLDFILIRLHNILFYIFTKGVSPPYWHTL